MLTINLVRVFHIDHENKFKHKEHFFNKLY